MVKRLKITLMSILAFVMMFTVAFGITSLSSKTKTAYALSGSGTAESPYLISTKADLETFRNKVNAGETSANAQLTADINLENSAWTPIGTGSNKYSGTFDGNDFTVSGLYINSTSSQQGFFGKIG
ncbi:MAG: hypothetical protein J6Z36_02585, partial [Clostridia bacterium]|nr:hypothetical protein [Clostridia bacterium]